MKTYLLLFSLATFSSLALTPTVRRLCQRFRWLDESRGRRRIHARATPRLGGIAIYLSLIIGLLPLLVIDNAVTASLSGNELYLLRVLVPATLTLLLGVIDDLWGLNAAQKFCGLVTVALIFYALGGRIDALSIPLVGSVATPGLMGLLIVVVWIVGVTNAFNLLDGIDGLAAGAAVFSSLVLITVSLVLGKPMVIVIGLVFSGALIGFLRYNFSPASIFLGDSGALLIGFLLAALSVEGAQKASTAVAVAIPLLALGLPIVDTALSMARRFISHKPLFAGDREHIHHKLLERGWSQKKAALVLYGVCAVFGVTTLLSLVSSERIIGLVLFVLAVTIALVVGHLRYYEIEELKASVKRNLVDRRIRGANNITVRRASQSLRNAGTLSDLFAAVADALETGEFTQAVMVVGEGCDPASIQKTFARESRLRATRNAQMHDGLIWWRWEASDSQSVSTNDHSTLWSLRIPMATKGRRLGHLTLYRVVGSENLRLDVNYLCTLFQEQLTAATVRLLGEATSQKRVKVARVG